MNNDMNITRSRQGSNDDSIIGLANNYWLCFDEMRNHFIDSLKVNQHCVHLLTYIGEYFNRIFENDDNELLKLYIPIMINDPYNVIMAMLDGVLFIHLINKYHENIIDLNVIELPNINAPQPLKEQQISANIIIIFDVIKSLNIQLPHWSPDDDYFDSNNTVTIILSIVFQLFYKYLNNYGFNIKLNPELIRLCQNQSERVNAPYLSWKKWLNKWLLHLKQPAIMPLQAINITNEIKSNDEFEIGNILFKSNEELIGNILHIIDYNDYLILICCRMDKKFLKNKLPQIELYRRKNNNNNNNYEISKLIYECIINEIYIDIEENDIGGIVNINKLLQYLRSICTDFV